MGWDFGPKPIEGAKAYCDGQLTWESEMGRRRVLESAMHGFTEYYAAVEHIHPDGSREVWAAVTLLRQSRHELGCKGMTEHMGPYYFNCPARILDLLTPTDNEGANKWREDCRTRLRKMDAIKAIRPGDRFVYQKQTYRLEKRRPWVATCLDDGRRYRFTRGAKMGIAV